MDQVETTVSAPTAAAPRSLYVVSGLALLWNAFAAFDYTMTRLRNLDWLANMPGDPNVMLAYIDSFPLWAQIGWGLGVWGGVAGSILLLLRSRHAVAAFALSLVGIPLSFGYQFFGPPAPPGMTEDGAAVVPILILAVAIILLLYARAMKAKGVLR